MRDWKQELNDLLIVSEQHQQATTALVQQHHHTLIQFFRQVVVPAFELLRTALLQRQRDAAVAWSDTAALSTDLSARFTLYAGPPHIEPHSLPETVQFGRDDRHVRGGLGSGLDALLPSGLEEMVYSLGVRHHEGDLLLVAQSQYIEQPTGQRRTREQPFSHQIGTDDLLRVTTNEIIEQVLAVYRLHLEEASA
jgi:hypothetical protein